LDKERDRALISTSDNPIPLPPGKNPFAAQLNNNNKKTP
jgi:hypothetical protein